MCSPIAPVKLDQCRIDGGDGPRPRGLGRVAEHRVERLAGLQLLGDPSGDLAQPARKVAGQMHEAMFQRNAGPYQRSDLVVQSGQFLERDGTDRGVSDEVKGRALLLDQPATSATYGSASRWQAVAAVRFLLTWQIGRLPQCRAGTESYKMQVLSRMPALVTWHIANRDTASVPNGNLEFITSF